MVKPNYSAFYRARKRPSMRKLKWSCNLTPHRDVEPVPMLQATAGAYVGVCGSSWFKVCFREEGQDMGL
eukprot:4970982-Amphidinium_carterae.1